ncbi:hypothetical protein [Streptomyces sp. NPDC089799]|uniref:hypothetical protein n=1 Tax=Streptomyces sp. NPDC089799 TaxID=3155066 RepID=UPI00341A5C2F
MQNQHYGQTTPPPAKAPMGTGKKIGIGCGGLLGGLILISVLGALIGPDDDSKTETKPSATAAAPSPAQPSKAPTQKTTPAKARPAATLTGLNMPAWVAAMEGAGIDFESKGEQYTPPGGAEAFKDWKGKNQKRTTAGLYLKATATAYASDGAVLNATCKAQEAASQEAKVTAFFEKCVTALAVPGLDTAKATGFVKENTARMIAASGSQPATRTAGGVTLRIDDDLQTGAAQLTITAKR